MVGWNGSRRSFRFQGYEFGLNAQNLGFGGLTSRTKIRFRFSNEVGFQFYSFLKSANPNFYNVRMYFKECQPYFSNVRTYFKECQP